MMMLGEILTNSIEKTFARTPWAANEENVQCDSLWNKSCIDKDWIIHKSKIFSKLVRLTNETTKKLIGLSLDEEFIKQELYPLYSKENGYVELSDLNKDKIRIAQLSDLHIYWKKDSILEGVKLSDGVLDDLKESLENQNIDIVALTGDTTDNGLGYIKVFTALSKWAKKGKLITVPGNHDINRLGPTKMASRFKENDYNEFSRICMGNEKNNYFTISNDKYAVCGINSNSSKYPLGMFGNGLGYVREDWLDKLRSELRKIDLSNKFKILMLHHAIEKPSSNSELDEGEFNPVEAIFLKLLNSKKILEFCKEFKFNLVLHGHEHVPYMIKSKKVNDLDIISAPSSTISRKYNIVEIDGGKMKREIISF